MSKRLPDRSNIISDASPCARPAYGKFIASALLACTLAGAASSSTAADRRVPTERYTEYGQVINVQPIYREVRTREPRQECWTEEQQVIVGYENTTHNNRYRVHEQRTSSAGNAIVGGLIGGVIGNQLGRSYSHQSRTGATVAGAIIGGAIANETGNQVSRHRREERPRQIESRPIYETQSVQRCKQVLDSRSQQQLQHYNVTYRYKGREFVTQTQRDPGDRIELQVSVAPARR